MSVEHAPPGRRGGNEIGMGVIGEAVRAHVKRTTCVDQLKLVELSGCA
jgi:hypothetical protein